MEPSWDRRHLPVRITAAADCVELPPPVYNVVATQRDTGVCEAGTLGVAYNVFDAEELLEVSRERLA